MIFDEVENLIGYAEQPDDYAQTIGDYLIKLFYNEPQVPYFDEFGAELYEFTCQEIEEELKILFEVSKHFVMKAVRNEETIKILKTLVSDLAKIGHENYGLISNIIDTIADNYAAQNHVFTMIENLDEEIQLEIETIAKHCRQVDYKAVEIVKEPKEDSWVNFLMDNGQNLLELIGVKGNENLNSPELLVFEDGVDNEEVASDNFDSVEQYEVPEDTTLKKSVDNLAPIVINLVIEPESPEADDNGNITETEEIINLLLENPEAVELLLEEIKPDAADEAVDDSEVQDRYENIFEKASKNENFEHVQLETDIKNEGLNEDSENKNLNLNSQKLEALKPEKINEKGIVVKIPYPEENHIKNQQKLTENFELDPENFENPGIVPEAGNFKFIFPIKEEENDKVEESDENKFEKEMKNEEIMMMEPENLSLETERDSDELLNDEDLSSQKSLNINKEHKNGDELFDSGNNDVFKLENEESPLNTKKFVEFEAEDFNQEFDNSEMNSKFESFLNVPQNFWEIPFGFWQSFQNFLQNITNTSEFSTNSANSDKNFSDIGKQIEDKSVEDSDNLEFEQEHVEENNVKNFDNEENSPENIENLNKVDESLSKNKATKITEKEIDEISNINNKTYRSDKLEEDTNVEQFRFEEGIDGIDEEIVSEIKEKSGNDNTKYSKSIKTAEFKDDFKSKIQPNFEIKKSEIPNQPKTFDDENSQDYAIIDGQLEETENKEYDFIPQIGEDKNIKDDDFGEEVLKFLGISNDKKETEDNVEISKSKSSSNAKGSLKIQNLTNQEEAETLEKQKQLLLELLEGDYSESQKIIDNNPIEFEGEVFDDDINDEEEFNKTFETVLQTNEENDDKKSSIKKKIKNSKKNEKNELENSRN